jgi:hypothetical protein
MYWETPGFWVKTRGKLAQEEGLLAKVGAMVVEVQTVVTVQ